MAYRLLHLPDGRSVPAEAVTGQLKQLHGLIARADALHIAICHAVPKEINPTNCLETINKLERIIREQTTNTP